MLLDYLGNPVLSNRAATAGYTPGPRVSMGTQPRDLPIFNFLMIRAMLMEPTIRLGLAMREAPISSMEFAYKQGQEWVPGVQADNRDVGEFVAKQLHRIWREVWKLTQSQLWGWTAAEVTYRTTRDGIEFGSFLARRASDVRALEKHGALVGVRFQRLDNSAGFVNLGIPGKAIWVAHKPNETGFYGDSILRGCYSPWADKWLNGGALDVRRLFMQTDSYSSIRIGYPPGTTIGPSGIEVPNRDIAQEMGERHLAGNVIFYPVIYDEHGNLLFRIEDAKVTGTPSHILQYPKDCDTEILRGMEIPDDVVTTGQGQTGAWRGKAIPAQAFYQGLNVWGNQIVEAVVTSIIEPLVVWNFGRAEDFEVTFKPFDAVAMEGQFGAKQPAQPDESFTAMLSADPFRMVGEGRINAAELVEATFRERDRRARFARLAERN